MNTEKIKLIRTLADELLADNVIDTPEDPREIFSDEEISEMLTGKPDFYLQKPSQYEKMLKYFDPEREPFDGSSWFRTAYLGVDSRPFKPMVIDGVEYRRTTPQAIGADYYWIGKGVMDLSDEDMWVFEPGDLNPSMEVQLDRIRRYEGGLLSDPESWPEPYRSAWLDR